MIGLLMKISRGAHAVWSSTKYNTPLPPLRRMTRAALDSFRSDVFSEAGTRAYNPPITLWIQQMFARDIPLLMGLLSAPLPSLERPGLAWPGNFPAMPEMDSKLARKFMLPKSPGVHPIDPPGQQGRKICGIDETGTTSS
jgi:hypothetical protein